MLKRTALPGNETECRSGRYLFFIGRGDGDGAQHDKDGDQQCEGVPGGVRTKKTKSSREDVED